MDPPAVPTIITQYPLNKHQQTWKMIREHGRKNSSLCERVIKRF